MGTQSYYQGKTAIVTGAASGIGNAIYNMLASYGCDVAGCDINEEAMRDAAEHTAAAYPGIRAMAYRVDVSDESAVSVFVAEAAQALGRLDFMFNIAGIALVKEERYIRIDQFNRMVDINLKGVLYGTHYAYAIMREQGFGHILNMSSVSGLAPSLGGTAYSLAKFGVTGYTLSLRTECHRYGVRASVACIAGVKTPMLTENNGLADDDNKVLQAGLNKLHLFTPEEAAQRILKLMPRNSPVLVVDIYTWLLWALFRFSPFLFERLLRYSYVKYYRKPKDKLKAEQQAQNQGD